MPPIHEGILSIRGNSGGLKAIKRWNKRYMVLSPDSIIPFFPETPLIRPDTANRIYLAQVKRLLQPKSEPDRFEVYFLKTKASSKGSKLRQMSFQAENGKEARIWMRMIVSAVRDVHTKLSETSKVLPARKRFSLPFVVSIFGHSGIDDDGQITKALSPRRRLLMRQRSMSRRSRKKSNHSPHSRTLSQTTSPSRCFLDSAGSGQHESELFESMADMVLSNLSEEESRGKRVLLLLLGDDNAILQTMLALTESSSAATVCAHLPDNTGHLLQIVMRHKRFPALLESALRTNYGGGRDDLVATVIRLRWWSLLQQLERRELSKSSVRDHFAYFLSEHIDGDTFTIAAKDASIACLKGTSSMSGDFILRIQHPEAWKGLLLATVNCPQEVKNEVFKDIAFLVVDNSFNAQSLYLQEEWLQWILQPVLFERSGDMDKHMRLRMLFLTLLYFHLFFLSHQFESILIQTLCRLHLWGLDGRIAANAMLECLVAKLRGATHRFSHDFDSLEWKNMLRLLHIVQVFVFCTADWDKTEKGSRSNERRRMSTFRVESEPRSATYYTSALEDARNSKTIGHRRFGPHFGENGESDIIENCYALLKSLGLVEADFSTVNIGRLDSITSKAVAFAACQLALFFRDATVFLLLLDLRISSVSELQIRFLTRSLLRSSSNSSKRLDLIQRLARMPLCEVEAVQMLSGMNHRASDKFINIVVQNSHDRSIASYDGNTFVSHLLAKLESGDRRVQMRVHRQCFFASELVRCLIEEKLCPDVDSAILVGTLLHGTSIISCVGDGTFGNTNALFRFACHNNNCTPLAMDTLRMDSSEDSSRSNSLSAGALVLQTSKDGSEINFVFEKDETSSGRDVPMNMAMTMSKAMSLSMKCGTASTKRRPTILDDGKQQNSHDYDERSCKKSLIDL